MNQNGKEERYLRDTLTILEDNLPKKRRRVETETAEEDLVGHEVFQENRKMQLKELLPLLINGRIAINGTMGNDHDANIRQKLCGGNSARVQNEKEEKNVDEKKLESSPIHKDQMTCYRLKLDQLKKESEDFQSKTTRTFRNYAKLVSAYEFGLKRIGELKDLSAAPDNILDGNFTRNVI